MSKHSRNGNGRHKKVAERRYVDFTNNQEDRTCLKLAGMPFSLAFIASKSGLTKGQVSYRLTTIAQISRSEIRNGSTTLGRAMAQLMIDNVGDLAEPRLLSYLRKNAPASYAPPRDRTASFRRPSSDERRRQERVLLKRAA